MSVLNENTIIGASAASSGYEIDNSLRFNDDDSAYLSRTPSVAGNRKTWTWSGWVKRGNLNSSTTYQQLFTAGTGNPPRDVFFFDADTDDSLCFYSNGGLFASGTLAFRTNALFRDTSAGYHVVLVLDTANATAADRLKLYVNGLSQTFSTYNAPSLNADSLINTNTDHAIGRDEGNNNQYFDGYLAEVNFIDGLALTPASFGEFGDYGEWKPLKYTGSYGTNGFYLDFKDSGSLGNDAAGSNNWTPTNLAATDQMLDSPTNNFATLNPLDKSTDVTLKEGNLVQTGGPSAVWRTVSSTQAVSSGKWYWEQLDQVSGGAGVEFCGFYEVSATLPITTFTGSDATSYGVLNNGKKYNGSGGVTYAASWTTGDIIGCALDLDAGTFTMYKNNVSQGVAFSGLSGTYSPTISTREPAIVQVANFGQDSSFAGNKTAQGNSDSNGIGDFYYAPPAGFLALCTQNLPEPTVIPSEHFNTVLYSGNGATQSVTGVGFQPDLTWIKERSHTSDHVLHDAVRGAGEYLQTSLTAAEATSVTQVISFDSDGFTTLGAGRTNESGQTYVAWHWKANGAGVSNTDGTITSTVSANVDAGFSIVAWGGNSTNSATVGHGLSVPPELLITKCRGSASSWVAGIGGISGFGVNDYLTLQTTYAKSSTSTFYQAYGASTFTLGVSAAAEMNKTGQNYITYAFHSVNGYSKVGSYTGNGSADGTFVHCGFRPAYVMVKRTNSASNGDWSIFDGVRGLTNGVGMHLRANTSEAELAFGSGIDLVSNGFKIREAAHALNSNGSTYIYLAFAESPFKYSNAR
jgi:hypothetical protein